MTRITTVLFDLDGTILDTNELIIQSFLHALRGIAPPEFGREHIIPSMGMPLEHQLRLFSGREQVEDLIAAYRAFNLREHDAYVKPFPLVGEVLAELRRGGLRLGVVTTKMRLTTEKGLRFVGIYDDMDAIVTIDDVAHPKPHPEPVETAMRQLAARPEETLMVGDSVVDIQSAAAAGAVPVGVAWSLKGANVLREAGARYVIDDMRELYDLTGLEREPVEKR